MTFDSFGKKLVLSQLKGVRNWLFELIFHSIAVIFFYFAFSSSIDTRITAVFLCALYLWQRYLLYFFKKIYSKKIE